MRHYLRQMMISKIVEKKATRLKKDPRSAS